MDKEKAILLKIKETQFKILAHAKVESGEKSWESFILWLNTRALTKREYEVVKLALEEQIESSESYEGIDGSNPVQKEMKEAKQVLETIRARYEPKEEKQNAS